MDRVRRWIVTTIATLLTSAWMPQRKSTSCTIVIVGYSPDGMTVTVSLTAKARPSTKIARYELLWGDGTVDQGTNVPLLYPSHTYAQEGSYTLTLRVWDTKGGSAESSVAGRIVFSNSQAEPPAGGSDDYAFYCQGGYAGSGTVRMTDGTDDDVQAKIDLASNGDIICIPAGSYTWDEAVVWIDKDILIMGAGVGQAVITGTDQFHFFIHITDSARGGFRISGLTLKGSTIVDAVTISSISLAAVPTGRWRIDHIHQDSVDNAFDHGGVHVKGVNYGVVDHWTIDKLGGGIFMRHSFGLNSESPVELSVTSITRSGSTATATMPSAHGWSTGDYVTVWGANQSEYNITAPITVTGASTFTYTVSGTPATPATGTLMVRQETDKTRWPGNFASTIPTGFGTANFVFVEDCEFNAYRSDNFSDVYDSSAGGGRIVWRYNTHIGGNRIYNHWTRGKEVAAQVMEIYNNSFALGHTAFDPGHIIRIEGGTGLFYNNYSNYNGGAPFIILDDRRSGGFGGPDTGEDTVGTTWELCDGTHAWDGNAGDGAAPGWPCLGQIGRGWTSNTSFVNLAAGTVEQPSEPFYLWNNGTQVTCATGGACTESIFVFPDPSAYIKKTTHAVNGEVDYAEDSGAKPGYTAYTYPHPLVGQQWP